MFDLPSLVPTPEIQDASDLEQTNLLGEPRGPVPGCERCERNLVDRDAVLYAADDGILPVDEDGEILRYMMCTHCWPGHIPFPQRGTAETAYHVTIADNGDIHDATQCARSPPSDGIDWAFADPWETLMDTTIDDLRRDLEQTAEMYGPHGLYDFFWQGGIDLAAYVADNTLDTTALEHSDAQPAMRVTGDPNASIKHLTYGKDDDGHTTVTGFGETITLIEDGDWNSLEQKLRIHTDDDPWTVAGYDMRVAHLLEGPGVDRGEASWEAVPPRARSVILAATQRCLFRDGPLDL